MSNQSEIQVSTDQAAALIHEFKQSGSGQIFHVEFIKRTTGELRKMNARFHVTKGVTGKGLKFKPDDKKLIGVYDCDKARDAKAEGDVDEKSFRMISTEAIKKLTLQGQTYIVIDDTPKEQK